MPPAAAMPDYGDHRRRLIVLDGGDPMLCDAAASVDLRLVARIDRDDPAAWPDTDVLALDLRGCDPAALDRLLDRAQSADAIQVACFDQASLDAVAASLIGTPATLLCAPTPLECVAALATIPPSTSHLREDRRDDEAAKLRQLQDEVARIARVLGNLAQGSATSGDPLVRDPGTGWRSDPVPVQAVTATQVRHAIRVRRLRDRFFDPTLFADPAWDMLLDLFAARLERASVSVSSLCIAAAVPPTTALRWITTLANHQLVRRVADPADRRRIYIALSDPAAEAMQRYFATIT